METPTLKLLIQQGPREGETLECKPGSKIRIGRVVRGNTFSIKEAGISSKHLEIQFNDNSWIVSDLDSSNGTFLNKIKLKPLTGFGLKNGDVIKFGEFTSVMVVLEEVGSEKISKKASEVAEKEMGNGARLLRRSARRGGAKESVVSNVENVVSKRVTRGSKKEIEPDLVSGVSKLGHESKGVENLGIVGEKRTRRKSLRSGGVLKDDFELKLEVGKLTRRGAAKKKVTWDESVEVDMVTGNLADDFGIEEVPGDSKVEEGGCGEGQNLAPVEDKETKQGAVKKKTVSEDEPLTFQKVTGTSVVGSGVEKVPECSNFGGREEQKVAPVEEEDSRKGAVKRKKVSEDEPLEFQKVTGTSLTGFGVEKVSECSNLGRREEHEVASVEEKQDQQGAAKRRRVMKPLDSVSVPVSDSFNLANLEKRNCNDLVNKSDVMQYLIPTNSEKFRNGFNMEKMTLGEWFDYLEVYLPKQIQEKIEEIILSMRERSQKFNEFVSHQQDIGGKIPVSLFCM